MRRLQSAHCIRSSSSGRTGSAILPGAAPFAGAATGAATSGQGFATSPDAPLRPLPFALTLVQLLLLLGAVHLFAIERGFGLVALAPVILLGFCVHAWLPRTWQPAAFLAISLIGFGVVLGPAPAAVVVGLGLGLVGIAHLPIPYAARVLLLLAAGASLTAMRADWIHAPLHPMVLPVLGSLFMFRLAIYVYDRNKGAPPAPLATRLSYFFLLPNVCFLLFPVVDYRAFCRGQGQGDPHENHQRGIQWMLRGLVHLLLYRFIYLYFAPDEDEANGPFGVLRFVLSGYLLFLRISGHFHFSIGLLHLFGFRLPATNHHYLLASSFTDCWRRINVYWTDFMKKLVYFPVFMGVRRLGTARAMVVATGTVFLATWLLHAYQWFWLQGALPLAADGMFWGLAGVLAVVTALAEARGKWAPVLSRTQPSWKQALSLSLRTLGVLAVISLVWSLWCSPSPEDWLAVLAGFAEGPPRHYFALAALLVALVVGASWLQRVVHSPAWQALQPGPGARAGWRTAGCALLVVAGFEPVYRAVDGDFAEVVRPWIEDQLNRRDLERLQAGYYDRLIDREGFGGRASEHNQRDAGGIEQGNPLVHRVPAAWLTELKPNLDVEILGARYLTNRHGMRDRDYPLPKPPGTYRIALLGTCNELGPGVPQNEVWKALVEDSLERQRAGADTPRVEILNFAVHEHSLLQHAARLREDVLLFEPDLVLVSNHIGSSTKYLVRAAVEFSPWPEDVARILSRAKVSPGMGEREIRQRIGPTRTWVDGFALQNLAATCREAGIPLVVLGLPYLTHDRRYSTAESEKFRELLHFHAPNLGYVVLDWSHLFDGLDFDAVAFAETHLQYQPTALAHRRIADAFLAAWNSGEVPR